MIQIDTRAQFPVERAALLDLLSTLDAGDWVMPTVCPGWNVHDVVAHIVHDYLRRISGSRDGHTGAGLTDGETLSTHLARTNGEFVRAMRHCSPAVLIDLLGHLGPQMDVLWAGMDLHGPADLDVSWAGSGTSPAWLDIAREYTEHWVHQQQIRDAISRPGADTATLLRPVLVAFLHAAPVALREQKRPPDTAVRFEVTGPAGRRWAVVSDGTHWDLKTHAVENPAATVRLNQDTLWRLGSRGITVDQALRRIEFQGDEDLARAAAGLVAVVV